jgi:hypothetical protein
VLSKIATGSVRDFAELGIISKARSSKRQDDANMNWIKPSAADDPSDNRAASAR